MSHLEDRFLRLSNREYPDLVWESEVLLIPKRRFRFDFYHSKSKVVVEINGQIWVKGGHSSGKGLMRDYEKLNLAQSLGYLVFQLSSDMLTLSWIELIYNTTQRREDELKSLSTLLNEYLPIK